METYFELAGPEESVAVFLDMFDVEKSPKEPELLSDAAVCGYIRHGELPLDAFDEFLYHHEENDCKLMAKFKDDDVRGYYNNRCYAFLADDEPVCDAFF